MNLLNHTPGPWINGWGKVTDSDGKAICMVIHRKNGDNGNLIASAPELLRALERLVHPMADDEDLDYARAVIAKAKGQE